jgi:hypothetical protein
LVVRCEDCGHLYDDAEQWTICPHGPLWAGPKAYCPLHDLVHCFICKEFGPMTKEQVENTFTYHSPKGNQPGRYEAIRGKAKELAMLLIESCPESRERAVALTNLQQAIMWANASIAINE